MPYAFCIVHTILILLTDTPKPTIPIHLVTKYACNKILEISSRVYIITIWNLKNALLFFLNAQIYSKTISTA